MLLFVFQENISKAEVEAQAKEEDAPLTPYVVFLGDPHTVNKFFIIGEKEILIKGFDSLLKAIELLFALYYVCSLEYPKDAKDIYMFIQIYLLNLEVTGRNKTPAKVLTMVKKLCKE